MYIYACRVKIKSSRNQPVLLISRVCGHKRGYYECIPNISPRIYTSVPTTARCPYTHRLTFLAHLTSILYMHSPPLTCELSVHLRQSRASLYVDRASAGRIQFIWYVPGLKLNREKKKEKKRKSAISYRPTARLRRPGRRSFNRRSALQPLGKLF